MSRIPAGFGTGTFHRGHAADEPYPHRRAGFNDNTICRQSPYIPTARRSGTPGREAVLLSGQHRKELSQGFRLTTNNRMELMAVCVALEALKFDGSDVTVYSDSKYVVDAVTKGWLFSWVKKRFAGKKNPDLWMRFLRVYRHHNVRFVWVKGHADTVENNRCDQLAVAAANDKAHLLEDTGYEP